MNPSTLMPRKTEPVKEASMPDTLPQRYDDSGSGARLPAGERDASPVPRTSGRSGGEGERDRRVGGRQRRR